MSITGFNLSDYELTVTEFKGYKVYKEVMGEWCAFIVKGQTEAVEYWQCKNLLGMYFHSSMSVIENADMIMCRAVQGFCDHTNDGPIIDLNTYTVNEDDDPFSWVWALIRCSTTEELLEDMAVWFESGFIVG